MFVARYRKIFFALSIFITLAAIGAMIVFGFNIGIDFKGGSLLEVSYGDVKTDSGLALVRPTLESVQQKINGLGLGGYSVRPSSEDHFIVRTREISPAEKRDVLTALSVDGVAPTEERFNSIGPVVGKELRNKAFVAIVVVIIAIVLFVTFAFRKVSEPVSSWKYGFVTILALVHDVIVPTGAFIAFAHFFGGEIDVLFVTAILAILGYSVHDTIVVFDRVRENLRVNKESHIEEHFETTVGKSVNQTFTRSINTSLTIFIVLAVLYFMGGAVTKNFSFLLLVGVIIGTYSSIFLASPLLITLHNKKINN